VTKRIELKGVPVIVGTGYPAPFDQPCAARLRQRLGPVAGLNDFGVNLLRLPPGTWSSQRHWHTAEDEFIFVLEGEVVLITNSGEETLRAGDSAGFKAGADDGHQLQNRSAREAAILEVGSRDPHDEVEYSDIDMRLSRSEDRFVHKNGTPYPSK
jgi:uncharacterized cupin superfamily protein